MRKLFVSPTLVLALLATACGDETFSDAGVDAPVDSVDTTPDDTTPDETVPEGPILGAGPYPIADLTISITLSDGGDPSTYRISCLGDTATLTGDPAPGNAETMCLALNAEPVKKRIVVGDAAQACTLQYGGPEIATVTGTFDGADIATEFHRTDGCGIGDWELLSGILPAPG